MREDDEDAVQDCVEIEAALDAVCEAAGCTPQHAAMLWALRTHEREVEALNRIGDHLREAERRVARITGQLPDGMEDLVPSGGMTSGKQALVFAALQGLRALHRHVLEDGPTVHDIDLAGIITYLEQAIGDEGG